MRRSISSLSTASVVFLATGLASSTALAATGGPDAGGYTFADQADGAVYNYVDITATGTVVVSGDDVTGNTALGAPFTFYGAVYNDMSASTNGFITDLAGATTDLSNDCPLPTPPGAGAGSFRIAALHDDLVSDVYYQYFTEVEAAAVGYPGEVGGISVFQWDGQHFSGVADGVDVEVILFHGSGSVLTMVSADADGGSGSTTGIQNPDASAGLNYTCNTAGNILPGVTAVQFDVGQPPDSDCCTPSMGGFPGCTNAACQSVVCAADPFCCDTAYDQLCADAASMTLCPVTCGMTPPLTINELRTDQTGGDNDEYFEIAGPPGTPLTDVQYIVLGDFGTGEIEAVVDLTGSVIPPSGFFTAAEGSFTIGMADLTTFINFENADTVTHMLVGGLSASLSDNLDGDANGELDSTPWITVFDTVALLHPPSTDLPYGPVNPMGGAPACMAGPTCQEVTDAVNAVAPFHTYRCPDGDGVWQVGNQDLAVMPILDTPGSGNTCAFCGNGVVDMGEDCDDGGESAACNADCTLAMCGDGVVNMTAMEECDDAGESAACDTDCTLSMCGDGVANMTAGEACDDAGESAACNADCTATMCGDGIVNMTAGEECDDMGESAACDDDCTASMCGDGVVNTTAGETCDDGGRSDMCNDNCTAVSCGDGIVNMAAGEECDDMGESDVCDDDCTNAMCGDGLVNATAGEDCDDGGESDACDDDCTPVECGDGVTNAAAGEECDDGNTDDGDGCASDCTDEGMGSTGDPDGTGTGDPDGTGTGDTGGVDSTGGTMGGTSMTGPSTVTNATNNATDDGGDTDGDTDTDTAGAVPGDEGCNCSTREGQGGKAPWSVLALLGLGAIGRRRRRR